MRDELKQHLCSCLIPFWKKLRDMEYGGYYGWMDSGLNVDRAAVKGCILNSRILWFFSNAYRCLQETAKEKEEKAGKIVAPLKEYADCAYYFLRDKCLDRERGGVYWALDYKGQPQDTTKHTYNQAFAVYALSSYFRAYHDREALELAGKLIRLIEDKCFDKYGYKEALDRDFHPIANDKLSENGVMAERTMNTLLHVLEAYTEYLLACREASGEGAWGWRDGEPGGVFRQNREQDTGKKSGGGRPGIRTEVDIWQPGRKNTEVPWEATEEQLVRKKLYWILDLIEKRVYNPMLHRQEVFFNLNMESLIDLHSYGHDIEAAWLMDRCLEVLEDGKLANRMTPLLRSLEKEVLKSAYANHSLANECERGTVDTKRIWWVQAEAVVGFYNAWQKTGEVTYRQASEDIWQFIKKYLVDSREGGEWFWYTDEEGRPAMDKPIVEPWKCPYHNGRMCIEIIQRH